MHDVITRRAPNHFPKINPPAIATIEPKPRSNTQMTEKRKKATETKKVFCSLNPANIFLFSFKKLISTKSLRSYLLNR